MAVAKRPSKNSRLVRRKPDPTEIVDAIAASIDRQADHLLHLGFHPQAERLARRADDLRAGGGA